MNIIDEALLERFRGRGPCELCGLECSDREPHHAFARGFGGGTRLDVPLNLVALGSQHQFRCRCHRLVHQGHIPKLCVLTVIALREGVTVQTVTDTINKLRWS